MINYRIKICKMNQKHETHTWTSIGYLVISYGCRAGGKKRRTLASIIDGQN